MFIKYPKIHRLGAEETEGILLGECYIQEKIDGSNVSIWKEGDDLHFASRNMEIIEGLNGFPEYIREHTGVAAILDGYPDYRLYGEWLTPHSVVYNDNCYRKFYLYDIWVGDRMMLPDDVMFMAEEWDIQHVHKFAKLLNPTLEELNEYIGKSVLGEKGEGIVIKNPKFKNKFNRMEYAKIVTEEFKEANSIIFGGNNKTSDLYWEQYIMNKYITIPRVKKAIDSLDHNATMEDTARIGNTAYHDMLTEEIWSIQKKVKSVDFKSLQRLCIKKAIMLYHDILNNNR